MDFFDGFKITNLFSFRYKPALKLNPQVFDKFYKNLLHSS